MPTPKPNESREDFINRCMSDEEAIDTFPESDQRYAFCISQFKNKCYSEKMEYKKFDFDLKFDEETNVIEGYASTFGNIDHHNDIVQKGAYKEFIKKNKTIPILYQHWGGDVLGVWNTFTEDKKGLVVKGKFADIQKVRDIKELIKVGAIKQLSIGYSVLKSSFNEAGTRILENLDLHEVSLVTFPANEQAVITGIKRNKPKSIKDFEKILREVGYSVSEAKAIANRGFNATNGQREVDTIEAKVDNLINILNEVKNGFTSS